jgi:cobalt/nickel transport system permease protein
MHMVDALVSPAVGGTMWAAAAGTIAYCSAKVQRELDDRKVPLMGALGAFVFAAQMINFSIPGTGSSGHLGGGLLLSILLGPHAALLTIASVLVVQAMFFADGGLLALGCNVFNLGVIPAFIAYPLVYRGLVGGRQGSARLAVATVAAAVVGLQLGALGVVLETVASGISSLPPGTFLTLMQPIHLAIGGVEGGVTMAVLSFIRRSRPELLPGDPTAGPAGRSARGVLLAFLAAALLIGGVVSRYASESPDGLEWAISRITGRVELPGPQQGVHGALARIQEKTAVMPGYAFPKTGATPGQHGVDTAITPPGQESVGNCAKGAHADSGVAGVVGGLLALGLALLSGIVLKRLSRHG